MLAGLIVIKTSVVAVVGQLFGLTRCAWRRADGRDLWANGCMDVWALRAGARAGGVRSCGACRHCRRGGRTSKVRAPRT